MGIVASNNRKTAVVSPDTTVQVSYGTLQHPVNSNVVLYRMPYTAPSLPVKVDLRNPGQGCYPYPPVQEQALLSNCSSMAVVGALQCGQRKLQPGLAPERYVVPSALYNYYYARHMSGAPSYDSGTSVEAALNAMLVGVASETTWGYDPTKVNTTPTLAAQQDALHQSIIQYDRLAPTLSNLKAVLASGYPFLFTFAVTKKMDEWFRDRNQQVATGNMLVGEVFSQADIVGAHTVLVVGYDSLYLGRGAFLCRNSWGPRFGQEGHFWFPFGDAIYPDLSGAFFIVRQVCVSSQPSCVHPEDCRNVYPSAVCDAIPRESFM